jgi:hypothetical protein
MIQSNIEQAAKLFPETKLQNIMSFSSNRRKKTEEVQSKRELYIHAKRVDARLRHKKSQSMQILAQVRHQKEQFKKGHRSLLKKIAALMVLYQFMEKIRDLIHYGRLS